MIDDGSAMTISSARVRAFLFDGVLDGPIRTDASCSSEGERWR